MAVADLTGDGTPDIITANYGANTVSVLMGNGAGTFQPAESFAVGSGPESVAVADLGNGNLDIITANYSDSTVSVLLGNGTGAFSPDPFSSPNLPAGTFAVGRGPDSVAVADLTGDGNANIITANYHDNTVSVLLGNGDGSFQPAQSIPVGYGPKAVAVADVNGDGKADVITANYDGNDVSVLLGNGDGTFQPAKSFAVGYGPKAVAVADLTGDGKNDIITANYGAGTVSVLLGNGTGIFQPAESFAVGSGPDSLAVADLGNGHLDIVTANFGDNSLSVLVGNGAGAFQPEPSTAVGFGPSSVAVAVLTGDGTPDFITANFGDNTVSVLLIKTGAFTPVQPSAPNQLIVLPINLGTNVSLLFSPAAATLPASSPLAPPVQPVAVISVTPPPIPASQAPAAPDSSGQAVADFDLSSQLSLGDQLYLLDLASERESSSGMDLLSSLVKGNRPQASLVPQQQNAGAISTLLPGDTEDRTPRRSAADKPGSTDKIDLRPFLINPVKDTGPALLPIPQSAIPVPDQSRRPTEPSDAVFLCLAEETTACDDPAGRASGVLFSQRWEVAVPLALAISVALGAEVRAQGTSRNRQRPD